MALSPRPLLLCCFFLLGLPLQAVTANSLLLDDPDLRVNLSPYVLLVEDPGGQLSVSQLRGNLSLDWRPISGKYTNMGKTGSAWWIRFAINNPFESTISGVLEINYPILDNLQLFQFMPDGALREQHSGDHLDMANRPMQVRNPWIPVDLAPGQNSFYLRVATSSTVFVPLYFSTWPAAAANLEVSMLANGLFYGILLGLFAYNLFLYNALRERSYFWYLIYNLNMLLFMAAFDGLLWKWLPVGVSFQSASIYSLMFLHCIVASQFSRYFLHTQERFPRIDWLLRCMIILIGLTLISLPLIGVNLYNLLASLYVLLSSAVLLGTGIYVWRKGFRYGSYYTLAWGLLLGSLMLSTTGSLGIELAISYGTDWVKLGICVELFILSLGLADRINALKDARHKADEQAQQARLESLAQGRFLAKMSHEIRTPLNGVLGMLQLLRDTRLDSHQRFYVETINSSGNALISVINDILDYARIESGQVRLERIEFDLEELLSDSCSLFTAEALNKQLSVYCSLDPQVPRTLMGDPTRLKQVLLNLMSNALKFTEQGYIALRVELLPALSPGASSSEHVRLAFSIQDTGIGISADAQHQLFLSFAQADSSTTRRYGGSGLGLTISQELVTLMGGQIRVDSQPQHGACFSFTLDLEPGIHTLPIALHEPALPAWLISADPAAQACYARLLIRFGYRPQHLSLTPLTKGPTQGFLLACTEGFDQHQLAQLNQTLASHSDTALVISSSHLRQSLQTFGSARSRVCNAPITPVQLRNALKELSTTTNSGKGLNEYDLDVLPNPIGRPLSVLVAEDNPVNQMVVRGLLETRSCLVKLVPNGAEALATYCANPDQFQLILMDGEMPVMDGFEATRQIRAFESQHLLPAVTIVALTAHILDSHRQAGVDAGMNDYLAKPLRREALYAVLDKLITPDTVP
ncbi:hybrid sensor histidine kinase/response regulator [Halopseudomonas pelagia]|uniref:hybrid sensor histidine kinase/response regulator n=1 Tax=Halopseudomonas pelagia TaxID=553151 RepID=UPI00039C4EF0|nr:hybrid sensor histidine kinase/response regulator [Halopseudomonas pelagia]